MKWLVFLLSFYFVPEIMLHGQTPDLKRLEWPFAFSNQYFQSIKPAADNNLWLLASAAESAGQQTGGQLAKILPDGQVAQARLLKSGIGQEVFVLDFYEAGSGEKYALVFTEESPIPSVVQNGRLFVVRFNANWLQTWAREIKGAGSASFEFSKIETDAAGRIYCFFFDGAYHINCIHPDGNLIWSRSISSGIQANSLSGTIIGDFELDPAGQDLIVAIFAALA